jgi:hypothetical protein
MWLILDQIESKQCHFDMQRFSASLMCMNNENYFTRKKASTSKHILSTQKGSAAMPKPKASGLNLLIRYLLPEPH